MTCWSTYSCNAASPGLRLACYADIIARVKPLNCRGKLHLRNYKRWKCSRALLSLPL